MEWSGSPKSRGLVSEYRNKFVRNTWCGLRLLGGEGEYTLWILVDTIAHEISGTGRQKNFDETSESFSFDAPYSPPISNLRDSFFACGDLEGVNRRICDCRGGWVTIGHGTPQASVSVLEAPPKTGLMWKQLSEDVTRFSFPASADPAELRIFDLMGREIDRISIEPASQSMEYDTHRLLPGIYLASLGTHALKFVVR